MTASDTGNKQRAQKTITIGKPVFSRLIDAWEQNKPRLVAKYDVTTYTAYAQKLIDIGIEQDTIEGRFEITNMFENTILLNDYFQSKKNIEIIIRNAKLFCQQDKTGGCEHIGFVLSDPAVRKRAKELGVKLRRAEP